MSQKYHWSCSYIASEYISRYISFARNALLDINVASGMLREFWKRLQPKILCLSRSDNIKALSRMLKDEQW